MIASLAESVREFYNSKDGGQTIISREEKLFKTLVWSKYTKPFKYLLIRCDRCSCTSSSHVLLINENCPKKFLEQFAILMRDTC